VLVDNDWELVIVKKSDIFIFSRFGANLHNLVEFTKKIKIFF
jgi:hypothetical protein